MMKSNVKFNRQINEHRQFVARLNSPVGAADISLRSFEQFKIYTPLDCEGGPFPTLFYIAGNAFVASETGYTHFICSHISRKSRVQVVVIQHKLAPEFLFPHSIQDAWKTFLMILRMNKKENLKIDLKRMAIAGYSSGGNLAASLTIMAKRRNLSFARQILISPALDLSRDNKGFEEEENEDKVIPEHFVEWFLNLYIPENQDRKHPLLSPYWLDPKYLQGLPSTDILYGEFDRFRGDSECYSRKLENQGTPNCLFMFRKENHGLLWNNLAVINTISARLMLTFHSEALEHSLSNNNSSLSFFRFHRASRDYQYENIFPKADLEVERKVDRNLPKYDRIPKIYEKAYQKVASEEVRKTKKRKRVPR